MEVGGRPAKLNEKKGDGDLEREIKNKGDISLLEEQHENFVAAVTKWEMLSTTNPGWKQAAEKKNVNEKTYDIIFRQKTCNYKAHFKRRANCRVELNWSN